MSALQAPAVPATVAATMPATMQALVVVGPNRLEIREVPVPVPGPNEVLARVRAVSICGTDAHLIRGDYPGFWPPAFPFIPGHEWAGELVALGQGAERFSERAIFFGSSSANTPASRSSALLPSVTRCDQRRGLIAGRGSGSRAFASARAR